MHALAFDWLQVFTTFSSPTVTTPPFAIVNPLAGIDHGTAAWFHAHLTHKFVAVLRTITEFGSSEWIAVVLSVAVLLFIFKRWWLSLATLVVSVPGGMLLNESTGLGMGPEKKFTRIGRLLGKD